jgi:hypothetical protein
LLGLGAVGVVVGVLCEMGCWVKVICLPGLKTARHSSGVRWSGYDVMVFLEDGAEVPNRALKKGIVMDFRGMVFLSRGVVARKIGGRIGLEKVSRIRKNRERMEGELWVREGAEKLGFICSG